MTTNHPSEAFARLLKLLAKLGLSVERGATAGELLLAGPAAEKTPAVLAAVKAFRADFLAHLDAPHTEGARDTEGERCRRCGRTIWLGDGVTAEDVGRGCEEARCPYRGGR